MLQLSAAYSQGIADDELAILLRRIEDCDARNVLDIFSNFSEAARDTTAIAHAAVKRCGLSLMYASNAICDQKNIVLEAVRNKGYNLEWASNALRDNKYIYQTV